MTKLSKPPQPKKIPKTLIAHGDERIDDYYWLRDDTRKDPEVISYLEAENQYLEDWFATNNDCRQEIYEELVSFIPPKEVSMKIKYGAYLYFSEITSDQQYKTYYRELDGNKELVLDVNAMAEGLEYFNIASVVPSFDNLLIAYAEDLSGRREYNIKVKNLASGEIIDNTIQNSSGSVVWDKQNTSIYYAQKDPVTLIENKVFKHKLGTDASEDILIYEEKDSEFHLSIYESRTKKYLNIYISKTEASETWLLDLEDETSKPFCVLTRSEKHLYSVEDTPECFYAISNADDKKNFEFMKFNHEAINNYAKWETVIEHNPNVLIEDFEAFPNYIYLEAREDGLPKILKMHRETLAKNYIEFSEPAFSCYLATNNDYLAEEFYYGYSSPKKPSSIFKENIATGTSELVWQQSVSNYDETLYEVERLKITARDNTKVPVSLVYKKGVDLKNAPVLVYGYGSYGIIIDAAFRTSILPLLNRGFVFAVANIRGGSEMGRHWYEDGKILNKLNTFYDFIDATKALVQQGYGNAKNVYAMGGSAGGLLMGAVINMEPELYTGIISAVPFVDVVTTMSDESIPLTTFEYKEWGNPANKEEYHYIKSYSPYDNIKPAQYPAVLVTSSLYDSQVQYYEPAKYVPKLRDNTTSSNPILMKMNLVGGHAGKSGRLNALEESALDNAFLVNLVSS
ncbi:S9 family peptidase [Pelagibacterales bacterium]|nr:S9 family peptidase [Pelagibacterales bacterium]